MKFIRYTFSFIILLISVAVSQAQNFDADTAVNGNCGMIRKVSVYGQDNREEYCSQNMIVRELADSVAAFFNNGHSISQNGSSYKFDNTTLAQSEDLSAGQRFAEQPASAFCTGFLVGDDLVATAGHCVRDNPSDKSDHANAGCSENKSQGVYCKNIKIVFGYKKDLGGQIPQNVGEGDVYSCVKVVAHSLKSGPDYTIIKLDRKVQNRKPLAIDRKGSGIKVGAGIFVMGHPSGLPLKIANNAQILKVNENMQVNDGGDKVDYLNKNYSFLTNLDTFHGNSGSPVMNAKTLMVEGILVSGDIDYVPDPENPGSNVASKYPEKPSSSDYGKGVGEVATRISMIAKYVPYNKREAEMVEMNQKTNGKLYNYLMKGLLNYQKQNSNSGRQNGAVPIPNFNPDNSARPTPAVYHQYNVPTPKPQIDI
jgi:V8-like Glu-specific endopeptidase